MSLTLLLRAKLSLQARYKADSTYSVWSNLNMLSTLCYEGVKGVALQLELKGHAFRSQLQNGSTK